MKVRRQSKIIELVNNREIETQDELTRLLSEAGFPVTQATISRDIRELKLMKVTGADGRQKYDTYSASGSGLSDKLIRVLAGGVVSIDFAMNMVVIKTIQGMAMAVAAAVDAMNMDILGSIAGDDTVFCVTKSEERAVTIVSRLKEICANA